MGVPLQGENQAVGFDEEERYLLLASLIFPGRIRQSALLPEGTALRFFLAPSFLAQTVNEALEGGSGRDRGPREKLPQDPLGLSIREEGDELRDHLGHGRVGQGLSLIHIS